MRWKYDYTGSRKFGKIISDGIQTFYHFWIRHRVIVCDIIANYDVVQHKEYFIREDYWTDEKLANLHEQGYRSCENLPDHDNLAWFAVPVMIKLHGFKTIEIINTKNRDDPRFLNDRIQNNLLNRFARSLARAATLAGMDIQKLVLMAGLGVAAIIGMKIFGVF